MFTLPPATLPLDIIAKQNAIQGLVSPDAGFMKSMLNLAPASNMFNNPLGDAVSSLKTAISGLEALQSVADIAPGGGALLSQITGLVTSSVQMFQNFGTNIVPVSLTMPEPLNGAVMSGATALASGTDKDTMGAFASAMGLPSLGTVMTLSAAEYTTNTLAGVVDAANPLPMFSKFSSMLGGMTSGATGLISTANGIISGLTGLTDPDEILSVLTGGVSSIGQSMVSGFAGPLSSFTNSMFGTIKNQMAIGIGTSFRQMIETNYALKFMSTGQGSSSGGGYGGFLSGALGSAITNFPSPLNIGHIIP